MADKNWKGGVPIPMRDPRGTNKSRPDETAFHGEAPPEFGLAPGVGQVYDKGAIDRLEDVDPSKNIEDRRPTWPKGVP